jgi:DNA-damage-inducible protein D
MQNARITKLHRTFEGSVHHKDGVLCWYARDLQRIRDYTEWRNFELMIEEAKTFCKNSHIKVSDHCADVSKMIEAGKGVLYTEAAT